jgi:hypothetical protein
MHLTPFLVAHIMNTVAPHTTGMQQEGTLLYYYYETSAVIWTYHRLEKSMCSNEDNTSL